MLKSDREPDNTRKPRTTIETLPNELLLEIVEQSQDHSSSIPRRFSIPFALSKVNRRFRALAIPVLCRRAHVQYFNEYQAFLQKCSGDKVLDAEAKFVKHLILGYPLAVSGRIYCKLEATDASILSLLPNLQTLEIEMWLMQPGFLPALARHVPRLRHLSWVTDSKYTFPQISGFEGLRTFRVTLVKNPAQPIDETEVLASGPRPLLRYSTITTFCLHHAVIGAEYSALDRYWKHLHLPNLSILNARSTRCYPQQIFQFIDLHPTLIEVNVSCVHQPVSIRLEALLKLIEGTGLWVTPEENLSQRKQRGIATPRDLQAILRQKSVDVAAAVMNDFIVGQPDDFPDITIYVEAFAFKRRPVAPHAFGEPSRPGDSKVGDADVDFQCARYKACDLAIRIPNLAFHDNGVITDVPGIFKLDAELIAGVERLTVVSKTEPREDYGPRIYNVIQDICEYLPKWKNLRILSLDSRALDDEDFRQPLNAEWFHEMCDHPDDYDPTNPDDLLRWWRDDYYWLMAGYILQLAKACPTLEEIRLCLKLPELSERLESDFWNVDHKCIWSWKMVRDPIQEGRWRRRDIQAHGSMQWQEDSTQPQPGLEILVGQELEHSRRVHWRGIPLRKFACRSQDG
ncbi:hypothetical protein EIP91_000429 [Steccherinum ochraceum]|uniref:Uncharacterized protein n=1 Tax=Steccherinum ochraceum TaxID=92696 RepID=A0A4R0RMA6_9APHY|nr:hypothetical protein EIP91_000429 [Steccherinum ochraceum]